MINFTSMSQPGLYKNKDFKGKDAFQKADIDQYTLK